MKTKVLHLTQSLGGVETYLRNIIQNINLDEFELILISPFSTTLHELCANFRVKVYNVEMTRGFHPIKDVTSFYQICRILSKEKPNLVHVHSSKAGLLGRVAGRLCGVKTVFTPHGASYLSFTGFKRTFFFQLEVFAKSWTDRILAISYSEALRMEFEVGHNHRNIDVLLNAVPVGDRLVIPKVVKADKKIRVGTIARLTYQKNPILLIEIAKLVIDKYPNAEFEILGAGMEDHLLTEVNELVTRYSLNRNIRILDWGHFDNIDTYLKSLDVFVLTSIFEGLPLSLIEAMAVGVPCVVSKCDGCNDVIQNNFNGYSCMTKEEFFKVIDLLISCPAEALRISETAYIYVKQHHNLSITIRKLEEYYLHHSNSKVLR